MNTIREWERRLEMGQDDEEKSQWSTIRNESNHMEHLWISCPVATNEDLIGLIYLIGIRKLLLKNTLHENVKLNKFDLYMKLNTFTDILLQSANSKR